MYGSPARLRVEQEAARRNNGPVIISTLLSLLVVVAAVAVVAYLVLWAPSSAVDSAERLEPVGTALPAPTEQPTLPTPIPTAEPEPTALSFTGEAPEVTGLPTVAAPQEAGPTPTPRVVALPTVAAPTMPPAQPTLPPPPPLPPSAPVENVPVVALAPVDIAAPAAPTAAAIDSESESSDEPAPASDAIDDDPFDIFEDDDGSRIAPAQNDALERARALQDDAGGDDNEDRDQEDFDPVSVPEIVPIVDRSDGSLEIVMPDVDAMIDEITASVTDPNRNPNVGDAGRADNDRDRDEDDRDDGGRDRDDNDRDAPPAETRRKSARERINERLGRRTPTSSSRPTRDDAPVIERAGSDNTGSGNNGNRNDDTCEGPFANLPEDRRPQGFPFDDC